MFLDILQTILLSFISYCLYLSVLSPIREKQAEDLKKVSAYFAKLENKEND